jgi:hypothetical protein
LGGWGAPAIFKEAGRLLGKYFRLLHPFIAAFFLPVAIIQLLEVYGMAWIFKHHHHHHHPHPHPGPFPPHHHHHHHPHHPFGAFRAFFYAHPHEGSFGSERDAYSPVPPPHPHPPLVPLLIGAAIAILVWVLISLAIASISKAIAYIYSNNEEDPAIVKSIFKSLPKSLYHLFITTLWILLFSVVTTFILSLPFHLLLFIFKKKIHPRIIFIINEVVVDIALLLLGFVFLLAQEVAVLEPDNYGLAAIKKSWSLVKTKVPAALIFFLVNLIFAGLLSKLTKLAVFLPLRKLPFWTVYIFGVVVAVLYLLVSVYFLVVAIVLYFSCKLKSEDEAQYLPVNTSDNDNPYTPLVVPSEN